MGWETVLCPRRRQAGRQAAQAGLRAGDSERKQPLGGAFLPPSPLGTLGRRGAAPGLRSPCSGAARPPGDPRTPTPASRASDGAAEAMSRRDAPRGLGPPQAGTVGTSRRRLAPSGPCRVGPNPDHSCSSGLGLPVASRAGHRHGTGRQGAQGDRAEGVTAGGGGAGRGGLGCPGCPRKVGTGRGGRGGSLSRWGRCIAPEAPGAPAPTPWSLPATLVPGMQLPQDTRPSVSNQPSAHRRDLSNRLPLLQGPGPPGTGAPRAGHPQGGAPPGTPRAGLHHTPASAPSPWSK